MHLLIDSSFAFEMEACYLKIFTDDCLVTEIAQEPVARTGREKILRQKCPVE